MDKIIWSIILTGFLITLVFLICGCATLKGIGRDIGIVSPEVKESVPVPEPERQLWNAVKKSNWLVTVSILGIAAGVFALVNGATKMGSASIASGSVSLFMTLAVARFALWMAVFGLVGSLFSALFSILVRRKALVEIIRGVQRFKKGESNPNSVKYIKEKLGKQSQTTKRIVGNLKNEMRLKGQI